METVAQRFQRLRNNVPPHVTIVAVTKFQPARAIDEAIAAGATDVGENYVQEARAKYAHLERDARKHFIGHVQTNKAKAIAQVFDMVQSVDRPDAAHALEKGAASAGKTLDVLVQLNISPSERFGCAPADAPRLVELLRSQPHLRFQGVMAIGPITSDRAAVARAFSIAADVHARLGGPVLSIGMSQDYALAIEAGSTMVRIGSAIFGPRPARPASKDASEALRRTL